MLQHARHTPFIIRIFIFLSGQVYRGEHRQKSLPLERVLGHPDGHRLRVVRGADDRRPRLLEVSSWKPFRLPLLVPQPLPSPPPLPRLCRRGYSRGMPGTFLFPHLSCYCCRILCFFFLWCFCWRRPIMRKCVAPLKAAHAIRACCARRFFTSHPIIFTHLWRVLPPALPWRTRHRRQGASSAT